METRQETIVRLLNEVYTLEQELLKLVEEDMNEEMQTRAEDWALYLEEYGALPF